jgi:hypothetical protein
LATDHEFLRLPRHVNRPAENERIVMFGVPHGFVIGRGLCLAVAVGLIVVEAHVRAEETPDASDFRRPLVADDVARLEPQKLKELLVRCQDQIEITSKMDGVMINDMKLGGPNDQRVRTLQLTGRVRDEQQRAIAARVVAYLMQLDSFWNTSDDEFVVDPAKLAVTEPSAEVGAKNFGTGIDQFLEGKYPEADMMFSASLVENPSREVIHYWKVATAIAMKQTERAQRRLEILTRRNPGGSDTYAGQLQRLQGPYRRAIIEMEQKLMLNNRMDPSSKPK